MQTIPLTNNLREIKIPNISDHLTNTSLLYSEVDPLGSGGYTVFIIPFSVLSVIQKWLFIQIFSV